MDRGRDGGVRADWKWCTSVPVERESPDIPFTIASLADLSEILGPLFNVVHTDLSQVNWCTMNCQLLTTYLNTIATFPGNGGNLLVLRGDNNTRLIFLAILGLLIFGLGDSDDLIIACAIGIR